MNNSFTDADTDIGFLKNFNKINNKSIKREGQDGKIIKNQDNISQK